MSAAALFSLFNLMVIPVWALLVLAPNWKWTRVIAAYVTPGGLAIAWALIMLRQFTPAGGGFGSLDQVSALLGDRWLLLAGWTHTMIFDLFVAAWSVRDAQRLGIKHRYVIPCLALMFLAGPLGLLAYFGVRALLVRRLPV